MSTRALIGFVGLVAAIILGTWWYFKGHGMSTPVVAPGSTPAAPLGAATPAQPATTHPVPNSDEKSRAQESLPELAASDSSFVNALSGVVGEATTRAYLIPEDVIRHVVVTVDNLARQKVALRKRPVGAVPGVLVVDGDELSATLNENNYARYQPMVEIVKNLNVARLGAVYFHFYPLFQQAYQGLGYPNGYFNDRLVEVIDVMLATPQLSTPASLVRPNVLYEFADPALERLAAGQKLLIRMGPRNAEILKSKLRELRAAVTAAAP